MTKDGVDAAFELIFEELGSVIQEINGEGAQALQEGNYDVAQNLISTGKNLKRFQEKVHQLQSEWTSTFDENARTRVAIDLLTPFAPSKTENNSSCIDLSMNYGGAKAKGRYKGGVTILLSGSMIKQEINPSLDYDAINLRNDLLRKGKLIISRQSGYYLLQEDLHFKSPSGAAKFVAGCSVSGPREWKVDGTNLSLRDWIKRSH